jgi:glutamate N-acetyltransferase/amino-acid N-acetyltransferase
MLWAIGVGAKRRLPAAAAVNWVMKDGLGRLGKLIYAAGLGRTFDSNLKVGHSSHKSIF